MAARAFVTKMNRPLSYSTKGPGSSDMYGTRKSPQLDKPGFSQINLVFLQINLVYLQKPHFSGEKPGLSEILERENHHN